MGPGLKLKFEFLGPYEVSRVLGHKRYDVTKISDREGPFNTRIAADSMKPWCDESEEIS